MLRWAVRLRGPGTANQRAVTVRHCVYSFGGDKDHIDVHVFNTVSLTWRKLTPETPGRGERHIEVPSWSKGHTAVLIEYTVYLWGGWTNPGYCNVLYAFDVDAHTWFKPQVSGTVPEERYYHSACVLEKVMFIHGGWTQTGYEYTIYKLDTTTVVWSLINTRGTPPSASAIQSATIIGTKMFVCGSDQTIRVFDTETHLYMNTPSAQLLPERHHRHSAFTYNGELYIVGGYNNQYLTKMWKFSPETSSWKKVEPKAEGLCSWAFNMCCCMVGDHIVLFDTSGDLYVLDFSPSLKTLCKLAVIQYGLEQSELPHNIRWELAAMTTKH